MSISFRTVEAALKLEKVASISWVLSGTLTPDGECQKILRKYDGIE